MFSFCFSTATRAPFGSESFDFVNVYAFGIVSFFAVFGSSTRQCERLYLALSIKRPPKSMRKHISACWRNAKTFDILFSLLLLLQDCCKNAANRCTGWASFRGITPSTFLVNQMKIIQFAFASIDYCSTESPYEWPCHCQIARWIFGHITLFWPLSNISLVKCIYCWTILPYGDAGLQKCGVNLGYMIFLFTEMYIGCIERNKIIIWATYAIFIAAQWHFTVISFLSCSILPASLHLALAHSFHRPDAHILFVFVCLLFASFIFLRS